MKFVVSTHQGKLYDEDLDYIIVSNKDGEFAILKDHMPLVCIIEEGHVKMVREKEELFVGIYNGFLEFKGNVASVIAQEAFIGKTLDLAFENINHKRKERLEINRVQSVDFTQKEAELVDNLKKTKAGTL